MLRYSLGRSDRAQRVENAVQSVLRQGLRTKEIHTPATRCVGTSAIGDAVVAALREEA